MNKFHLALIVSIACFVAKNKSIDALIRICNFPNSLVFLVYFLFLFFIDLFFAATTFHVTFSVAQTEVELNMQRFLLPLGDQNHFHIQKIFGFDTEFNFETSFSRFLENPLHFWIIFTLLDGFFAQMHFSGEQVFLFLFKIFTIKFRFQEIH